MKGKKETERYFWPLPPKLFKKRLASVEELVKNHQSGMIIGCPGSGKSAYLRFLLSQKWDKLPKRVFVYCNFAELKIYSPEDFIFYLLDQLGKFDSFKEFSLNEGLFSLTLKLRNLVSRLVKKEYRITFIFDKIDLLESSLFPPLSQLIYGLWQIEQVPPRQKIAVIFIASPRFLEKRDLTNPLDLVLLKKVVFLPLLSKEEFFWSVKRQAYFYQLTINLQHLEMAWEVCGGMGNRIREIAFLLARAQNQDMSLVRNLLLVDETIGLGASQIWESLGLDLSRRLKKIGGKKRDLGPDDVLFRLGLVKKEKGKNVLFSQLITFSLPVSLRNQKILKGLKAVSLLTGRENQMLDLFLKSRGRIISKEKMARIIWGKGWEEKYSDWAISKAVERLKKKIINQQGHSLILTVRSRGYRLSTIEEGK